MTSHKSRIKVNVNVIVDVFTESHPEDIDEITMTDIIADHLDIENCEINDFEIRDVIQAEDVEVEIVK